MVHRLAAEPGMVSTKILPILCLTVQCCKECLDNDHHPLITIIMADMITIPRLSDKDDQVMMSMCGTLEYMSPEVMDCRHASPASDMW